MCNNFAVYTAWPDKLAASGLATDEGHDQKAHWSNLFDPAIFAWALAVGDTGVVK